MANMLAHLIICSIVAAVLVSATTDCVAPSHLHWGFRGRGFHMQLEIDYPLWMDAVSITFDLPKAFFIDAAEAEQQYRMQTLVKTPVGYDGTVAQAVAADITDQYTSIQLRSQNPFDIEAPVVSVNYTANHVQLSYARTSGPSALNALQGATARLVFPVHARYGELDIVKPFVPLDFILGEDAHVTRCLGSIQIEGNSSHCGAHTFRPAPPVGTPNCVSIPVGVLSDITFVYWCLMSLLVVGALIVVISI